MTQNTKIVTKVVIVICYTFVISNPLILTLSKILRLCLGDNSIKLLQTQPQKYIVLQERVKEMKDCWKMTVSTNVGKRLTVLTPSIWIISLVTQTKLFRSL